MPGESIERVKAVPLQEKVQLVLDCLRSPEQKAQLCHAAGVSEATHAKWAETFLEAGEMALADLQC